LFQKGTPVEIEYTDLEEVDLMVQYKIHGVGVEGEYEKFQQAGATNNIDSGSTVATAGTTTTNGTTTTSNSATTDPPTTSTAAAAAAAQDTTTQVDNDAVDLTNYEPYPNNTPVLMEFSSGWYEGFITAFSPTTAVYEVTWNDGTIDKFDDLDGVDEMVQNAIEYEPWPTGTAVVDDEDGSFGKIFNFTNGHYVVQWDDDSSTNNYYDFDTVDDMVTSAMRKNNGTAAPNKNGTTTDNNATATAANADAGDVTNDEYLPWENGTPVAWGFDDGWWEGTITGYSPNDRTYEITWSDDTVNTYTDLDKVDDMVETALHADEDTMEPSYEASFETTGEGEFYEYDIGTFVYREFDTGWWVGNIVSVEDGYYTVRWTDNSFTYYEIESEEIDRIVSNADNIPDDSDAQVYPLGTPVYKEFGDDGWYHGKIVAYSQLMYTMEWEDGEQTYHVNGQDLDTMVSSASANDDGGMTTAGKFFLSVFVMSIAAALAIFRVQHLRRRSKMIQETVQASVQEVEELDRKSLEYSS
jgi:hypothetical protein